MTELELAQHLYLVMGGSARAALRWSDPADGGGDLGPFQPIIDRTLSTLSIDNIADADVNALKAVGEWRLWESIADETALDYDESQGDRTTSLSQMTEQATKRSNRAYFDSLKYHTHYRVRKQTVSRKPTRFGWRRDA